MAFLFWGHFTANMNTAVEQIGIRAGVSLKWMFASDSDYNKQCGLAGECCIPQLTDQAVCSNLQRVAYFVQKHPSDCDEKSRAAIIGMVLQRAVMKNGLYMYQGEKEGCSFFKALFSCMKNVRNIFEHKREWNGLIMSRTFLSWSQNSIPKFVAGIY